MVVHPSNPYSKSSDQWSYKQLSTQPVNPGWGGGGGSTMVSQLITDRPTGQPVNHGKPDDHWSSWQTPNHQGEKKSTMVSQLITDRPTSQPNSQPTKWPTKQAEAEGSKWCLPWAAGRWSWWWLHSAPPPTHHDAGPPSENHETIIVSNRTMTVLVMITVTDLFLQLPPSTRHDAGPFLQIMNDHGQS